MLVMTSPGVMPAVAAGEPARTDETEKPALAPHPSTPSNAASLASEQTDPAARDRRPTIRRRYGLTAQTDALFVYFLPTKRTRSVNALPCPPRKVPKLGASILFTRVLGF